MKGKILCLLFLIVLTSCSTNSSTQNNSTSFKNQTYYFTTANYAARPIRQAGGQVYSLGEYTGIEIPSDQLFDPNSAEFLPDATPLLDSIVDVLRHYPDHNILISGNTSGFSTAKREQKLSERRARQIASFLWVRGINNSPTQNNRSLTYIGYGSYLPISSDLTNEGVRENSRIQITIYPKSLRDPCPDADAFGNIGAMGK
jgi:outer membrane protein OmpA-like peptidoglycan-associated protein